MRVRGNGHLYEFKAGRNVNVEPLLESNLEKSIKMKVTHTHWPKQPHLRGFSYRNGVPVHNEICKTVYYRFVQSSQKKEATSMFINWEMSE